MRNIILITALSLLVQVSLAQQFVKKSSIILPEQLNIQQAEWVDLNNDSLLDVVFTGVDQQNGLRLGVLKNISTNLFSYQTLGATGFNKGTFASIDINHDNKNDLVLSGTTSLNTEATFTFLNKGNLSLQKQTDKLLTVNASLIHFSDLNNDGKEDILLAGTKGTEKFFKMYAATPTGYALKLDTTGIEVKGLIEHSFTESLYKDIIISGTNSQGAVCLFMKNKSGFKFTIKEINSPMAGTVSTGDLNADGNFDLIICGTAANGIVKTSSYLYANETFTLDQTLNGVQNGTALIADLNSDGLADIAVNGTTTNQKTSFIQFADKTLLTLNADGLIAQHYGDFDRDGDLDFFQFADSSSFKVFRVFENTAAPKNAKPKKPVGSFAISTFNKTFIYWQAADDDHTISKSLTYDVYLQRDGELTQTVAPGFDISNLTRTTVSHGNAGTKNSMMIRNLPDGQYYYYIQSVDNAFNGSNPVCSGGSALCFNLEHKLVQACVDEIIKLKTVEPSFWFSTTTGFLQLADSLQFTAAAADTIYAFSPTGTCVRNMAWAISVHGSSPKEKQTIHACEGEKLKLKIETGWNEIVWKTKSITIKDKDSIEYTVSKADTIIVTAKSKGGCTYEKKIFIKISKPIVTLNGETFLIMKGQSVQLEASGGDHYLWTPANDLSQNNIANPTASPGETTDYIVTVTDSIGCKAQGKVQVQISETAFIANLFTPNSDGKNDELKIYGLTRASHFKFRIYTREGNTVYETSNVAEATQRGWNGAAHGTPQPSGVYYWKVEGEEAQGNPLLLNGKRSGSILLVR